MVYPKNGPSSANDVKRTLNNKPLLKRIKPARLYARKASEALEAIKVSCTENPQIETASHLVFQAMVVLRAVPPDTLNRPTRAW